MSHGADWLDCTHISMLFNASCTVQRAWREHRKQGRLLALCMAAHCRLGASALWLGMVLQTLCDEDLKSMTQ
jgi:hypothetical protein